MIKKIFLDINIIVDFLDSNRKNHDISKLLIKMSIENDIDIVISEDMLSTIYYIVKDKEKVLDFFEYIHDRWIISSFGPKIIKEAIKISKKEKMDLEDTLQCLCAKENECKVIITSDKKFCYCGVNILDAEVFLKSLKR